MPHRPITVRIRAAIVTTASLAVLAGIALPGAATAGGAPLIDGSRPAPAPVTVTLHTLLAPADVRPGVVRGTRRNAQTAGSPAACSDRAMQLMDNRVHWQSTYAWSFRARSTPSYLDRRSVANALRRGITNITDAVNDCGRSDRVSATATFLGITATLPAPTADLTCAGRDGQNVVGFGRLPTRYAGLTCIWSQGDRIIEADIKLNKRSRWATSLVGCNAASLIEAVTTHEAGHVFGLGHVSETTHGRLTMSERLDGQCQNSESTLGNGDMRGLETIY